MTTTETIEELKILRASIGWGIFQDELMRRVSELVTMLSATTVSQTELAYLQGQIMALRAIIGNDMRISVSRSEEGHDLVSLLIAGMISDKNGEEASKTTNENEFMRKRIV